MMPFVLVPQVIMLVTTNVYVPETVMPPEAVMAESDEIG